MKIGNVYKTKYDLIFFHKVHKDGASVHRNTICIYIGRLSIRAAWRYDIFFVKGKLLLTAFVPEVSLKKYFDEI